MPRDLKRRLEDIQANAGNKAMIDAAQQMLVKPFGWLYIWGGPGNAKSEVLIALSNELNEAGRGPVLYTKFSRILDFMRDAFSEKRKKHLGKDAEQSFIDRFERLKRIPVIAIDEMDKARETEFAQDFRFDFLDDRYRQAIVGETITLFAGNTDPATFDVALYDRIRDGRFQIVHNKAGSARPYMRRDE